MTNTISSLFGGSPSLDKAQLDKAKRKALDQPQDGQPDAAEAPARSDELVLSPIAQRAMAEPAFNREKVEAIKQAIKDGSYPMDARRIAQSFASIEKLIG